MPDVICLGELLIDFVANGPDTDLGHVIEFRRAPGGAPANVACGVVKLGGSAAFIGKVGADPFGDFLRETLDHVGVNTRYLMSTGEGRTTLVFVGVHHDDRRDMCFFRNPGADMLLGPEDIDLDWIAKAEVLHFGSLSMTDPRPRAATIEAVQAARRAGLVVSFDPNYRPALWPSRREAQEIMAEGIRMADVVKISQEELLFVAGTSDVQVAAAQILATGSKLLFVSRGARGSMFFSHAAVTGEVPGFGVKAIETTGAGDAFLASILVDLLAEKQKGRDVTLLGEKDLRRICTRANAAGALTCTRAGAIPGLPTREEVDTFLAQNA